MRELQNQEETDKQYYSKPCQTNVNFNINSYGSDDSSIRWLQHTNCNSPMTTLCTLPNWQNKLSRIRPLKPLTYHRRFVFGVEWDCVGLFLGWLSSDDVVGVRDVGQAASSRHVGRSLSPSPHDDGFVRHADILRSWRVSSFERGINRNKQDATSDKTHGRHISVEANGLTIDHFTIGWKCSKRSI